MIEKSFGKNRYFERIVITQTQPVCGHVRNRKNRLSGNPHVCTPFHSSGGSRSWQGRLNHREHSGSQGVVIFLFYPLCVPRCPLWFSESNFENIKKSPGFWFTTTRRYQRTDFCRGVLFLAIAGGVPRS